MLLFAITLYMLLDELYILARSVWDFNKKDSVPGIFLYMCYNLSLHVLVLHSITQANDEEIQTEGFWRLQSWVALAIWIRFIISYFGEIDKFNWVIGLIKHSGKSTIYFLIVFTAGVTAFADSFNAFE